MVNHPNRGRRKYQPQTCLAVFPCRKFGDLAKIIGLASDDAGDVGTLSSLSHAIMNEMAEDRRWAKARGPHGNDGWISFTDGDAAELVARAWALADQNPLDHTKFDLKLTGTVWPGIGVSSHFMVAFTTLAEYRQQKYDFYGRVDRREILEALDNLPAG